MKGEIIETFKFDDLDVSLLSCNGGTRNRIVADYKKETVHFVSLPMSCSEGRKAFDMIVTDLAYLTIMNRTNVNMSIIFIKAIPDDRLPKINGRRQFKWRYKN